MYFICKAKNLKDTITKMWLKTTIPVPPLETVDFSKN
jgi:hypothetical protein